MAPDAAKVAQASSETRGAQLGLREVAQVLPHGDQPREPMGPPGVAVA